MRFVSSQVEFEFHERLHPVARGLVMALDDWSRRQELPEAVVTCVSRDPNFYKWNKLPFVDSWHLYDCAVDLRSKHYEPVDALKVQSKIREMVKHYPDFKWEVVFKDHGTGPHFHLAVKDLVWKATYMKKETPVS